MLSNFGVRMEGSPGGVRKSYIFTVRKNGISTGLTVTVTNAFTFGVNASDSVSFNSGDIISIQCVPIGKPTPQACAGPLECNDATNSSQGSAGDSKPECADGKRYVYFSVRAPSESRMSLITAKILILQ